MGNNGKRTSMIYIVNYMLCVCVCCVYACCPYDYYHYYCIMYIIVHYHHCGCRDRLFMMVFSRTRSCYSRIGSGSCFWWCLAGWISFCFCVSLSFFYHVSMCCITMNGTWQSMILRWSLSHSTYPRLTHMPPLTSKRYKHFNRWTHMEG